ncbi:MAG TPA: cytochrome c maturation protein CcmE [Labilithrix sp.]|nr:cytochrome c maturation protein CcmE [Labilithrix sp.]
MSNPTDDAEPEAHGGARRAARAAADDDPDPRKRRLLLVSLVMAAAGIVGTVLVLIEGKGTYSKPVDELLAQRSKYVGRPVRAEGLLVHGSLARGADGCDHRFTIARNGAEVPVRFPMCVVPDSLRDVPGIDVEVNVEGELHADGSLGATRVFTKCPSKYDEEKLVARGEKRPH